MADLTDAQYAALTYGAVGLGTEGGRNPYRLTVATNAANQPIGNSGYSLGVMQFDFGQRGAAIDPLSGHSFAKSYVAAANLHSDQIGLPRLSDQASQRLLSNPKSAQGFMPLSADELKSCHAFDASPEGKKWIFEHLERPLLKEYQAKISPLVRVDPMNGWAESDKMATVATLAKAMNQSPNNGFNQLESAIRGGGATFGRAQFDQTVAAVSATNPNFHFQKAAQIGQQMADVYAHPAGKQALDQAGRAIASPAFHPDQLASDPNLFVLQHVSGERGFAQALQDGFKTISQTGVSRGPHALTIEPLLRVNPGAGQVDVVHPNSLVAVRVNANARHQFNATTYTPEPVTVTIMAKSSTPTAAQPQEPMAGAVHAFMHLPPAQAKQGFPTQLNEAFAALKAADLYGQALGLSRTLQQEFLAAVKTRIGKQLSQHGPDLGRAVQAHAEQTSYAMPTRPASPAPALQPTHHHRPSPGL